MIIYKKVNKIPNSILISNSNKSQEKGIIMVSVLLSLVLFAALFGAHFVSTKQELGAKKSHLALADGFYASEAGLNIRSENIRSVFQGYSLPIGESPNPIAPCEDSNMGTGDMACQVHELNDKTIHTYVEEINNGDPIRITIPIGEAFSGLSANEYRYDVRSIAKDKNGKTTTSLGVRTKSRLVPIFQFFALYNQDLEIYPAEYMNLTGPIYSTSSIFLSSGDNLDMSGSITAGGNIFSGRKETNGCQGGNINILDPVNPITLSTVTSNNCSGNTFQLTDEELEHWNGNITTNAPVVSFPEASSYEMGPDETGETPFWDSANIRIVLALDSSNNLDTTNHASGVEVRNLDGSFNLAASNTLHTECPGAAAYNDKFKDWHINTSGQIMQTLNIDVAKLIDCLHEESLIIDGIDTTVNGGLVVYTGVDGPDKLTINTYAVKYENGAQLAALNGTAPNGLTFASSQSFYLQGDYNTINKIPALIVGDRFNALSNDWRDDATYNHNIGGINGNGRKVTRSTTYNLAILANNPTTGGANAPGGMFVNSAVRNGGLQNFPIRHERWFPHVKIFHGAYSTLGEPKKSNHSVTFPHVSPPPSRDFTYDEDFFDTTKQPPLAPAFVYLKQEFFVRYFE